MKTVLIMRHGKSSWKNESLPDHDRPLNHRGERNAKQMGERLKQEGQMPDLILTSTARRVRATAELLTQASGYTGDVLMKSALYLAGPEIYLQTLAGLPDEVQRVLVIGHNPGLEQLVEVLTGQEEHLPTAAIAQVELPIDHWEQIQPSMEARLVSLTKPD